MGSDFENSDVRWVITVPAIWKQPAKQFMREAAYQVRDTGMGWGGSRKGSWDAHSGDGAWVLGYVPAFTSFLEDGKGNETKNILVLPGSV